MHPVRKKFRNIRNCAQLCIISINETASRYQAGRPSKAEMSTKYAIAVTIRADYGMTIVCEFVPPFSYQSMENCTMRAEPGVSPSCASHPPELAV